MPSAKYVAISKLSETELKSPDDKNMSRERRET